MSNMNQLPIGHIIGGHYEILKVLGQGGFGIVYLVKDLHKLDEILVAKELFAKEFSFRQRESATVINQSSMVHIFQKIKEDIKKEVTILSKISNPNIVKAYGYLEENDTIYSLMEYIQGMDLERYLKEHGSFSEKEAQELLLQLIHGLKPIHAKNIIHRDIKPNNIIRTPEGVYKIIDFSSNKQYVDGKTTTITSYQNPIYTAPELMQKKTVIGEFSDIYSIGMTLVRTLSSDEKMPNITDRFVDDSEFQEAIDKFWVKEDFATSIKKMIELNYQNRFQNLDEIEHLITPPTTMEDIQTIDEPMTNMKTVQEITKQEKKKEKKALGFFPIFIIVGIFAAIGYSSFPFLQKSVLNYFAEKNTTTTRDITLTDNSKKSPSLEVPTLPLNENNRTQEEEENEVNETTQIPEELSFVCTDENIKLFLDEFMEVNQQNNIKNIVSFYTPKVNQYYNLHNISSDRIIADKKIYVKRWYKRDYRLLDFNIIDHYVEDGVEYCQINKRVSWNVESKTHKKSGESTDELLLVRNNQEKFKIYSIYTLDNQIFVDKKKIIKVPPKPTPKKHVVEHPPKYTPKPHKHVVKHPPKATPKPHNYVKRTKFPTHNEIVLNGSNLTLMVRYPKYVRKDEKVVVNVKLINRGAPFNGSGGVSISFPGFRTLKVRRLMSNFSDFRTYTSKNKIYHRIRHTTFRPKSQLLEVTKSKWNTNEAHGLSFEIIPNRGMHRIKLLLRASISANRITPTNGMTDQQGYPAKLLIINLQ